MCPGSLDHFPGFKKCIGVRQGFPRRYCYGSILVVLPGAFYRQLSTIIQGPPHDKTETLSGEHQSESPSFYPEL